MRRSTSARSVGFARSTSAIAAGEIPPTYKDCPASATRENFVRRREETGPSEQRDTYRRALLDSVDVAQGGRLAGFDRNPVEQDFAEGPDDVDDEVPFPRGRPAREDDEVVVESPTERRPNGGRSIGHPSEEDWLAAILARHGRHRVRVDVIDLSRLDPLTWRDELVARGQDRNRWPHECLELRPSDRRED